jgi:hypothetical protein
MTTARPIRPLPPPPTLAPPVSCSVLNVAALQQPPVSTQFSHTEHVLHLQKRGHPRITLHLTSSARSPEQRPLCVGQDPITGSVAMYMTTGDDITSVRISVSTDNIRVQGPDFAAAGGRSH